MCEGAECNLARVASAIGGARMLVDTEMVQRAYVLSTKREPFRQASYVLVVVKGGVTFLLCSWGGYTVDPDVLVAVYLHHVRSRLSWYKNLTIPVAIACAIGLVFDMYIYTAVSGGLSGGTVRSWFAWEWGVVSAYLAAVVGGIAVYRWMRKSLT